MNNIDEIIAQIAQIQEDAVTELLRGMSARDRLIVEAIIAETKDMRMTLTSKTNKQIAAIQKAIVATVVDDILRKKVVAFVNNFDDINTATHEYFRAIDENFTVKERYNIYVEVAKQDAINNLLTNQVNNVLAEPIKKIMLQHVTTGASKEQMIDTIKEFVEGTGDKSGAMDRYYSQVARDTINQFERTNSKLIADDLGYDKYKYNCGTVDDTRPFCKKRECEVFTKAEVEAWADTDWVGKIPGTNADTIFINLGGYNCMHKLNGISDDLYEELKKDE